MILRARMIHILLQGTVETGKWFEAFRRFERKEQAQKWYKRARRLRMRRSRNDAINTVLPHKYISGDAITFCLAAVKHKPPLGTYVYDILLSLATVPQLWNILWRNSRTSQDNKISTIIYYQ